MSYSIISNRNLLLAVTLTLLSVTAFTGQRNKSETSSKNRAERSSPFLIQSIPEYCRGKRSTRDYYYIESSEMLPMGRWCVALLMHAAVPPGMELGRYVRKIVGVVAINVQTKKVLFLPSQLARTGDGKAREIVNIKPLSSNSCTLAIVESSWVAQGVRKNFYEEAIMWKWKLPTGKFTKLGVRMHVRNLAKALDHTPYSVKWPLSFRRDWNGKIQIVSADGKTKFSLQTVSTSVQNKLNSSDPNRRFPGDLDKLWTKDHLFAPAKGSHSLVVLREYRDNTIKILIKGIRLSATPTVKWTLNEKSIREAVKASVYGLRLISGVTRPCLELPIIIESLDGGDFGTNLLCSLNTETGKLRKIYTLGEDAMFPAASPSGKKVAIHNGETDDEDQNNKILVIDIKSGKTKERVLTLRDLGIAEPQSEDDDYTHPLVTPLGFKQNETLILESADKIWSLPPPYTGKLQLVFSLKK